jgi:hypothetical protein
MIKRNLFYIAAGLSLVALVVFPSFISLGVFIGTLMISLDEGVRVVVSSNAVLKVEKSIHVSPHFSSRSRVSVKQPVGRPFSKPFEAPIKRPVGRPRRIPLEMVN